MIFNMVCGGGSAGSSIAAHINVVGGTSAPPSPNKNTLWVNTDTTIDQWSFSSTDPDYLGTNGVWIKTGTGSPIEFNVLDDEKYRVYVYPIGVKRWDVSTNSWIDLQAKFWNGTEWADLIYYLFNAGDECSGLTGGWESYAVPRETGYTPAPPNLTKETDSMYMVGNIHSSGIIRAVKKVGFSGVKKIVLDALTTTVPSATGEEYHMMGFYLWSAIGSTYSENIVYGQHIGGTEMNGEYSFDVSDIANGEYYIGFGFYSTNETGTAPSITLRSLRLEY